jgi:hypothetical protein
MPTLTPLETTPLRRDEFFDAEEEGLASATEEIPRQPHPEDTDWELESVHGCRHASGAQEHLVKWVDSKKKQWLNVTHMLNSIYELVTYWRSAGGLSKLRDLSSGLCTESFSYDTWTSELKAGVASEAHSVWYVAAVQLTAVPHPTHASLRNQLISKRHFTADATFEVWVVPKVFYSSEATVLIPLVDVRYSALPKLFKGNSWDEARTKLVDHVCRLAPDCNVPLLWLHTTEQDEKASIFRHHENPDKPLRLILNSGK